MKISCTKENLLAGLSAVARVASKNPTLPILGNVLLRVKQGALRLEATNLEVAVTTMVRAKIEREGAISINARLLTDFIGLLDNERVELEADGMVLRVAGTTSTTVIRGMAADDFPIIPTVSKEKTISLSAANLRRALGQVLFAAAQDASRPEISGVFAAFSGKSLTLAATDSYRLAERRIELEAGSLDQSTILPARALFELVRMLPADGSVQWSLNDSQALFVTDQFELSTRLIEGQYPDYQQIIPQGSATTVTVTVDALTKLVKTASLFCRPGINDVTVEVDPAKKTVACAASNSELGEHRGAITAKTEGKLTSIVFNFRYLLDGLVSVGTPTVTLGVSDSASPGILRPSPSDEYLYLIMPIRQ